MKYYLTALVVIFLGSLLWWKWPHLRAYFAPPPRVEYSQMTQPGGTPGSYRKAYFAAGCFWCAES